MTSPQITNTIGLIAAFTFGVVVMACFEYPAITTCHTGLLDKNDAIARLEDMVRNK